MDLFWSTLYGVSVGVVGFISWLLGYAMGCKDV